MRTTPGEKRPNQEKPERLTTLMNRARETAAMVGTPLESMNQLAKQVLNDSEITSRCKNKQRALETILQANNLTDIGKSGKDKEPNKIILRIYQVTNLVENPENITLSDFLITHLTNSREERDEMFNFLKTYGINAGTTMREFYNLHTGWSLEIIDREVNSVSEEVRNAVARHHFFEGVRIVPGELTLEDKCVIMLDKYDACRTRGEHPKTHEETIAWIRKKIRESGLSDDKEFEALLSALERVAPSVDAYRERRNNSREVRV